MTSPHDLDALVRDSWPGNIRELENVIARVMIIGSGPELRVPVEDLSQRGPCADTRKPQTLEEAERQHILRALRQTQWRIAGPRGAATLLNMKRTTLQARMRKLNIRRPI